MCGLFLTCIFVKGYTAENMRLFYLGPAGYVISASNSRKRRRHYTLVYVFGDDVEVEDAYDK